jgi:hypothetical protein
MAVPTVKDIVEHHAIAGTTYQALLLQPTYRCIIEKYLPRTSTQTINMVVTLLWAHDMTLLTPYEVDVIFDLCAV